MSLPLLVRDFIDTLFRD